MKHLTVIIAFLVTLSAPVAAQDFQKGLAAFEAGDFATVLQEWTPLAEAGDADAQYNLGFMYAFGEGVPQDYKEAYAWLSVAKANGLELAEKNLGIVTKKMTKEQIAEAQSLATEIQKRIEANKKD